MHKSTAVSVRTIGACIALDVGRVEVAVMIHMISVTASPTGMLLEGRICWLLKLPSVMRSVSVTISVHGTAISTKICAGN